MYVCMYVCMYVGMHISSKVKIVPTQYKDSFLMCLCHCCPQHKEWPLLYFLHCNLCCHI